MPKQLTDALRETKDDDEAELTGTDLQEEIFETALLEMRDNPDMTVQEFADEYEDYSQPYTDQILRRADVGFAEEAGALDLYHEEVSDNGTGQTTHKDDGENSKAILPDLDTWIPYVPNRGYMVDVEVTERCPECDEFHDVVYLVPLARSTYLEPPECGHKRVIGEIPDEVRETINARRTQIRRLEGGVNAEEEQSES